MSFLDNVKTKYETPGSSIGADFIRPALSECVLYRRETGWFRSSALRVWAGSIINVLENDNVKIQIIAYPEIDQTLYRSLKDTLSQEEKQIRLQQHRESILLKALTVQSNSENHTSEVGKYIGELLSYLIASEKLEIKFVTLVDESKWKIVDDNSEGEADGELTHIKRGYFEFSCGTYISFNGSANESLGGLMKQGEVFYVFDSRKEGYKLPARDIKDDVDITWEEKKAGYKTHKISRKLLEKIKKISPKNKPQKPLDLNNNLISVSDPPKKEGKKTFKLRKHQELAIENWIKNDYRGIVEHATGSGKTITGIYAIKHFFEKIDGSNAIVIVPSVILQTQWLLEIREHLPDVDIHRVGGKIGANKWKKNVITYTSKARSGKKQIVLGVRQSICSQDFFEKINQKTCQMLLVDEVHTIGASESRHFLNKVHIKYRLGLSATYQRANDYLGTKRIIDYFSNPIEPKYGLSEAIADKRLVQYDYHVEQVSLNAEEEELWIEQSKEISREWAKYSANKKTKAMPKNLKMMLIKRSEISKKAINKIKKALEIISKNYNPEGSQRWLVYCQDIAQLEELLKELFNAGYPCSKYYAELDKATKNEALEEFYKNGGILLSIKCLDEGVDIPAADHALIIASSSNKREYIQRRGRVLRIDKNNFFKRAKIFDLITVAQNLSDKYIKSLVSIELTRASEFAEFSRNKNTANIIINELFSKFEIKKKESIYVENNDIEYEE